MTDLLDGRIQRLLDRDEELLACPWPLFDDVRSASDPAFYSEAMGAWVITSYQLLRDIVLDPATWSNRSPTATYEFRNPVAEHARAVEEEPEMAEAVARFRSRSRGRVLNTADPPEHVRQRRALNRAFRPARLRALEPEVKSVSDSLVAAFAQRGRADLVREYAVLLPMVMISRMLGVPEDELEMFKGWSDDFAIPIGRARPSRDEVRSYIKSEYEFDQYFSTLVEQRQAEPRNDLISDVANAEVDGEPLTYEERMGALRQFLLAGNETTTTLLGNIGHRLATNHDLRDRLASSRDLVPAFVEEALRHEGPVTGLFRVATCDTDLGGKPVAKGEFAWLAFAAANRDPEACPMPDAFKIDRDPNDHVAFGYGEHYCIGQGLARLEAKVGTNAMLDLPNVTLANEHTDAFMDSYILRGRTQLLVTFDPTHSPTESDNSPPSQELREHRE
ncbi:cytochrome P450 [Candidatus Poriferisocius sp.]|uniref:cytochrome P450 n=1 Tax=Candidatus Poriferisocius sp. TaxID=3101276 RepID=UPI003B527F44